MAQRRLLYGGSFDPVHHGHLIIARAAAEQLGVESVVLLPSGSPPHKQDLRLADADARLAMLHRAVEGEPLFEISEHDLLATGPTYTVHTIAHFLEAWGPDVEVCWLLGGDSLRELHLWYQVEELVKSCRVVTAARPGSDLGNLTDLERKVGREAAERLRGDVLRTPNIEISATQIRERVREGRSIRYLVPDAVADYIAAEGLYAAV